MKCAALVLVLCALTLQAQALRIGGGAAPMENILKPIQASFEKATGLKLELHPDGPDTAFREIDLGKLDAATAGLGFQSWLELMAANGYQVKDPKAYVATTIGTDRIHVLVHPDLAVLELSKAQLKGIFSGKVTSWKEVGGPDVPITIVWGTKIPGTNKLFQEKALDNEPMTTKVKPAGTTPEILSAIAQTPGAIGIGPFSTTGDWKVWAPKLDFELGRPIILITKGPPSPSVEKLLAYIRKEAQ
jgi:phosphate transport system substrate-binding protein